MKNNVNYRSNSSALTRIQKIKIILYLNSNTLASSQYQLICVLSIQPKVRTDRDVIFLSRESSEDEKDEEDEMEPLGTYGNSINDIPVHNQPSDSGQLKGESLTIRLVRDVWNFIKRHGPWIPSELLSNVRHFNTALYSLPSFLSHWNINRSPLVSYYHEFYPTSLVTKAHFFHRTEKRKKKSLAEMRYCKSPSVCSSV